MDGLIAQMDNSTILGIAGFVLVAQGVVIKIIYSHRSEFSKHKDSVQYKDVCEAKHEGVEASIAALKELVEQRFDSLEGLIKNNGSGGRKTPGA